MKPQNPSPPRAADLDTRQASDPGTERRILLSVAYDGTDFSGFQIQPQARTVQGVLTAAIETMEQRSVKVRGAGRTDAGVHALDQKAAFATNSGIPCKGYLHGLNTLLPADVAVRSVRSVPRNFDPRFWTCLKVYRYAIYIGESRDPFLSRASWHVRSDLDHQAMARTGSVFSGRHDFNAFRAADCERKDPVRTLNRVDVFRYGNLLFVEVEGFAFLKYMVRVIVGTLVEVGRGKMTKAQVAQILESKDRTAAGPTAPACGLTLVRVTYPDLPPPDAADLDAIGTDHPLQNIRALFGDPFPETRK